MKLSNLFTALAIIAAILLSLGLPAFDKAAFDRSRVEAAGPGYKGVIIVAKAGGDYTSITSALNSISDNSSSTRYLIWVAPGTYIETVTMKSYVDIEGAGEGLSEITNTGGSSLSGGATVLGASNAELRFLTISSAASSTTDYAVALLNQGTSPRLTHVSLAASGSDVQCVALYNGDFENAGASPTLTDVTITASGGTGSTYGTRGMYNTSVGPATVTLAHVTISVTGADGKPAKGIENAARLFTTDTSITVSSSGASNDTYALYNTSSTTALSYVTLVASGSGNQNYAIYTNAAATFTDVTASASGADTANYAFYTTAAAQVTNATFSASGGAGANYGVYASAAVPLTNVSITVASVSGQYGYGVYLSSASSALLTTVTANVTGGTATNYGIYNNSSSPTIQNSAISASGGSTNYGVYNMASSSTYTVKINNSQITGATKAINNDAEFTTNVGGSLLDGGVNSGTGTFVCAVTYSGTYGYTAGTCP